MATIIRYVGEDIAIPIKKRVSIGVYRNLDDYTEILVYIDSNRKQIKFSKTGIEGTTQLLRIDEYTYTALLTSEHTTLLGNSELSISIEFSKVAAIGDLVTSERTKKILLYLDKTKI